MSTPVAGRLPGPSLTTRPQIGGTTAARFSLAVILLVVGLATFVFGSNYFDLFPTNKNMYFEGGLAAVCLAAALGLRRSERLKSLWPVAYAFFVANMVWVLTTPAEGPDVWALRLFHVLAATPMGAAVAKVGEAVGTVAIILVLCLPAGVGLRSLYLKRGNLKWAVAIGLLVILNFGTNALMASAGQPRSAALLMQLMLWGVVFSAANALMEELWFRGLFIGPMVPHIGVPGAVIVTALLFSLAHLGASYLTDPVAAAVFVVNTFTHALVLGYLVLKTDTLWGAVLYHMAMDIWLFVGPLGSLLR